MVRKDRRSGGFDADEIVSMGHVKTETPAIETSSARTGRLLHPWPVRIMHWVNATIYWPLPGWLFTLIYLLVFAYAVALLRIVPLRWR